MIAFQMYNPPSNGSFDSCQKTHWKASSRSCEITANVLLRLEEIIFLLYNSIFIFKHVFHSAQVTMF